MKTFYLAGFVPEEGSYTAYFPDFPNACICGETIPETIENAQDVLYECARDIVEKGKSLPDPSDMTTVVEYVKNIRAMDNLPYPKETVYQYVEMPFLDFKPVRINITVPQHALKMIDLKAKNAGMSRSSLMTAATLAY